VGGEVGRQGGTDDGGGNFVGKLIRICVAVKVSQADSSCLC
jgi:hypothetical protein